MSLVDIHGNSVFWEDNCCLRHQIAQLFEAYAQ